ncbi:MAG: adenylosuccinate lyase [Armatimonadetes bacterium CG07_land_8_20_14_0_80_40_9]|nr:MAG: adenylosuccinate lyase [Armatimonadetes bacterium CG07_land_8_20_14_0_80_40_9]
MIERYSYPQMKKIWEEENKFKVWLKVEIAICEGWAKLGVIPEVALKKIKRKARFEIIRIKEIEEEVRHDLIAFVKAVSENLGNEAKYLHLGVTSYDIEDPALSLLMKESAKIIIEDIKNLIKSIKEKAKSHKWTVMIGRTHGVHAEPITFGLKLAVWLSEMERNLRRMKSAREVIGYGKVSGAVGTYANIDPQIEEYVCKKLGLKVASVSTQILQRDRHAQFMTTLALVASSLEKFATEIRNLQRTEILEVEEYFARGQRGSSAMPHKRNPIICEQICGLSRVMRSYALASLENISLWHERDLTNSSVERVIIPDSCILIDYMLRKMASVIDNLVVHKDKMRRNLEKTKGLIFSQKVMLSLIEKGMSREDAYRLVQSKAMKAREEEKDFRRLLTKDKEIAKILSKEEINNCLDTKSYLKNLERVFKRVGM